MTALLLERGKILTVNKNSAADLETGPSYGGDKLWRGQVLKLKVLETLWGTNRRTRGQGEVVRVTGFCSSNERS